MADNIRDAIVAEVERRVRAEYEPMIEEEIVRRLAAVEAALDGVGTREAWPVDSQRAQADDQMRVKRQRKRRSDAGKPRIGRGMKELATAIGEPGLEALAEQAVSGSEPDVAEAVGEQDGMRCVTCGHAEFVHGDALQGRSSGCMTIGCTCKRFVAADPLGIDDADPKGEKGRASCDSES